MGQKLIARGLNNAKMKLAIDLGNGIGIITCAQHVIIEGIKCLEFC